MPDPISITPPAGDPPTPPLVPPAGDPPPPAAFKFPDGMPDHLRGANPEETTGKLFGALKPLLDAQQKRGPVASKVEDYNFQFDDKMKAFMGDDKDPAMAAFKAVALEHGVPIKAANDILNKVFQPLIEKGMIPQPYNAQTELQGIAKLFGHTELNDQNKAALDQQLQETEGWVKNLGEQMKLSPEGQVSLESLTLRAGDFEVVRGLQKMLANQPGFALGGQGGGQSTFTMEQWKGMSADPRIDPNNAKYDKAVRAQYDAAGVALFAKK
jgi:hypothetical protein